MTTWSPIPVPSMSKEEVERELDVVIRRFETADDFEASKEVMKEELVETIWDEFLDSEELQELLGKAKEEGFVDGKVEGYSEGYAKARELFGS